MTCFGQPLRRSNFGKKPKKVSCDDHRKLAAKAMKMKWEKNISLKEAWKRVRKNSFGKKSLNGRKSPVKKETSTKRKNPKAAQAMKLARDEDITLKEAWKRIKEKEEEVKEMRSMVMTLKNRHDITLKEAWKRARKKPKKRKNPKAAKAMGLVAKGLTLKAAWKKIKKDEEDMKKLRSKVMKMHAREGISLKAAWKKARGPKKKRKKRKSNYGDKKCFS